MKAPKSSIETARFDNASLLAPEVKTSASTSAQESVCHLYSEKQLAARWGTSTKKLQADRHNGGGCPFVRIGRLIRYRPADIATYEKANLRNSTSQGDDQ